MQEFIKRPQEVKDAIDRAMKAEQKGLLLTPLKRFQFENHKNYGESDDFTTERGEIFIAFATTEDANEYEYFLNGQRIISSPTIDALDIHLWHVLTRIITNYVDIKNSGKHVVDFPDLSERKLAKNIVLIYNSSADFVNSVIEDELSFGYFSSQTNTFFKDVVSIYLHKYLVCVNDEYKTLEKLIKSVKREDIYEA